MLIHYFADGQKERKSGEKIIRGKFKTLEQATILCVEERHISENLGSTLGETNVAKIWIGIN